MRTVGFWLVAFAFGSALLLFLGGILSAAFEIHKERRAGVPVARPGWHRNPKSGVGPVERVLLLLGAESAAARVNDWRWKR